MQGRHRSPVGIGQRISPDESVPGGHGTYGSGYRNLGRGAKYRRGPPPRSHLYLPPPPPPSKEDILMEAGRLAAEYLVARGILPQSSLPPRWQQQNGGFQEFKGRERESSVRTSVLDRLGGGNSESGHGRRRYVEEYGHGGQQSKGRGKRAGSYNRGHGSDWGRESGRSAGWMERSRSFNDNVEEDENVEPRYRGRGAEYHGGGRLSKAVVESEVACRGAAVESESDLDNNDGGGDGGSVKAGSFSAKEDGSRDTDIESNRESDDDKVEDMETEQERGTESVEVEKEDGMEVDMGSMPEPVETDIVSKNGEDLLRFCRFLKVPTKLRSSVANRGAKNGQGPIANEVGTGMEAMNIESEKEDEPTVAEKGMASESPNTEQEDENEVAAVVEPEVVADKDSSAGCMGDSFAIVVQDSSSLAKQDSTIMPLCSKEEAPISTPVFVAEKKTLTTSSSFPKSSPVQHPSELVTEAAFTADNKTCNRSYSFPDSSSSAYLQVDSSKSLPVPEASGATSVAIMDDGFVRQSGKNKRPRDWYTDIISQTEGYANTCNLNGKHFGPQGGRVMANEEIVEATGQGKMNDARLFQRMESESEVKSEEDRQLIPSSFKICDLNLTGTPEITEITEDPIQERISNTAAILQTGNVPSVEFGLSIGNNIRRSDIYGQNSNGNKVVQVIDLEDDSPIDSDVCDPSKPRSEVIYRNLECFLNNPESAVDLPDIQDGYGHAITDLLGSDITSCPEVAADMNSLQPGMALHGAEGMAGDDDSIYVSLGEIPIGFMDIWDPPPQEYGKYF